MTNECGPWGDFIWPRRRSDVIARSAVCDQRHQQRPGDVFEQAPRDMPWGVRMAALRDPEGYGVEIIGPLAAGDGADSK
jgi:hypothetical protein